VTPPQTPPRFGVGLPDSPFPCREGGWGVRFSEFPNSIFESQAVADAQRKIEELEKKLLVFYAGLANHYRKELISNAKLASSILRVEEPSTELEARDAKLAERPARPLSAADA